MCWRRNPSVCNLSFPNEMKGRRWFNMGRAAENRHKTSESIVISWRGCRIVDVEAENEQLNPLKNLF